MSAISVEGVSKRYRKGVTGYRTLREDLYTLTGRLLDFGGEKKRDVDSQHMWALRDVSFEVKPRERVGIIGRNGSGKTTLLRLLAGVTRPTRGTITVRGRMGVLIEIMAGFHPELTGRENVYLNGAIMGMSRGEIKAKFDEIVAFSEIEDWIDTPIKRYSSGMHVRLGFAVAAHLDPDILLVDEVLAVGDARFQQKCLGKMEAAAQEGRTVLFVSHNMAAVRDLCPRALWLDNGAIVEAGATAVVIDRYLDPVRRGSDSPEVKLSEDEHKDFQLLSARLVDREGRVSQWFDCDRPVVIDGVCKVRRTVPGLYGYLSISRKDGLQVIESDSYDAAPNPLDSLPEGMYSLRIIIPPRTLGPGDYSVYLSFASPLSSKGPIVDSPGVVLSFRLDDTVTRRGNRRGGFFSTRLPWEVISS